MELSAKALEAALRDPANADLWMLREVGLEQQPRRTKQAQRDAIARMAAPKPRSGDQPPPSPKRPPRALSAASLERLSALAQPKLAFNVEGAPKAKGPGAENVPPRPRSAKQAPPPPTLSKAERLSTRVAIASGPAEQRELGALRARSRALPPRNRADEVAAKGPGVDAPRPVAAPTEEVVRLTTEIVFMLVCLFNSAPEKMKARLCGLFWQGAEALPARHHVQAMLPPKMQGALTGELARIVGRGRGLGDEQELAQFRHELLASPVLQLVASRLKAENAQMEQEVDELRENFG